LKNFDIEKEANEAAKSGNVENYCTELAQRLEQSINEAMEDVIEYVTKFKEQVLAILREEEEREELGDVAENAERPDAKFKSLPDALHNIVEQLRKLQEDREIICNCLTTAVNEYPLILQRQITEEVARVIEKVSVAAKDLLVKLEVREPDEESCASVAETDEPQAATSSADGDGEKLERSESDKSSANTPITELGDEHVIPTPPPPPPVKSLYLDKVDEINERILRHRKHQVNQVKRELNFAIARLTSEVITSYEQASALQKQNSPVLEKSIIEFLKNQETKKTFFIKEITERLHIVLRMLTSEPGVNDPNLELRNLNETVKLLHLLQSTRACHLDKISVTRIMNEKNGVLFYLLLFVGVFLIVLALSLNGEWLALIMFVAIIFIFIVKAWQGIFSSRKRKIEEMVDQSKIEIINIVNDFLFFYLMAYAVDAYDFEISEDDLKHMKYYRERLNARPLTTALRSFDINENYESTRLPGVYEISQDSKVIYIGGNPCLSNIRDCLNAHFSGNDGLPIGEYLSGPAKNKWKSIFIRWLTCAKPNEVAWFLLSDFQMQHGCYPPFNYPAE
ncbi:unnamed protein product, partial [Porites lobata]